MSSRPLPHKQDPEDISKALSPASPSKPCTPHINSLENSIWGNLQRAIKQHAREVDALDRV